MNRQNRQCGTRSVAQTWYGDPVRTRQRGRRPGGGIRRKYHRHHQLPVQFTTILSNIFHFIATASNKSHHISPPPPQPHLDVNPSTYPSPIPRHPKLVQERRRTPSLHYRKPPILPLFTTYSGRKSALDLQSSGWRRRWRRGC